MTSVLFLWNNYKRSHHKSWNEQTSLTLFLWFFKLPLKRFPASCAAQTCIILQAVVWMEGYMEGLGGKCIRSTEQLVISPAKWMVCFEQLFALCNACWRNGEEQSLVIWQYFTLLFALMCHSSSPCSNALFLADEVCTGIYSICAAIYI